MIIRWLWIVICTNNLAWLFFVDDTFISVLLYVVFVSDRGSMIFCCIYTTYNYCTTSDLIFLKSTQMQHLCISVWKYAHEETVRIFFWHDKRIFDKIKHANGYNQHLAIMITLYPTLYIYLNSIINWYCQSQRYGGYYVK